MRGEGSEYTSCAGKGDRNERFIWGVMVGSAAISKLNSRVLWEGQCLGTGHLHW